MLYLSNLTLSHFRSHKLARLSLDGRPVVLFGNNGSGKTNILEAVSLFSPGRGMRRASAEDMTRRPEAVGWKLRADASVRGAHHEIETFSENGAARRVEIDGKTATQASLGDLSRVIWLIPSMDRLWIEGAENRRRFLDRMTLSLFPEHGETSIAYEKAMRERNRLLKDQVRDAHWYKVLEMQMAQTGHAIHMARSTALARILAAQNDAHTAFPVAELTLEDPDETFPPTVDDLKTALAENRARDLAAGRTLIGPHRTDMVGTFAAKGIPARDCSTGEQKALLVSMILANARALAQDLGSAPIILLDEVAAHLDAGRRHALYDEICALGAQAWMTGTEIDLFSDLGARAQYFEITEADSISSVSAFGS
jgi:DNA replication and repair protein RecF